MNKRVDEMDRITALPEPILHQILSFLPFEEVVQTSILSKRWKQAWDTYPILEFNDVCYNVSRKKETLKYLEQILLKRHMEMVSVKKLTFRMELSNYPELASILDHSLSYAVGCNVQELKLELVYWGPIWWYKLPRSVFCAKSIDVLDLVGCLLELGGSTVELPSLRKLLLKEVVAGDHVIENLVTGSPSIEYLKIDECVGFKQLELFGLSRLNRIKVCDDSKLERLDINSSNVRSMTIVGPSTCEINVASCKTLKRLRLYTLTIKNKQLCDLISELPLLEYLSIIDCNDLEKIKISSLCLKKLLIYRCIDLVEVKIETPNLSVFKYMGNIISFLSNDLALSETDLYFYSDGMDTDWFIAYIELLAMFRQFSEVLNLQSYIGENVIVPTEVRQIIRPPLSSVKHLSFTIDEEHMDFPIIDFVDGLLWISPHVETLSIEFKNDYCDKFSFQFSYKKELSYEASSIPCCSQFSPVSCWQDCIKKVEIEHTISTENYTQQYLFQDDESILEMINGLCRYKRSYSE